MSKTILILFFFVFSNLGLTVDIRQCTELSDGFCEELWSKKHKGNLKTPYGEIFPGNSSKSELTLVEKMDIQSLMENHKKFPEVLSKNSSYLAMIKKIKNHMEDENDSPIWIKELWHFYDELNSVTDIIMFEDFVSKRPEFKDKPKLSYSATDWKNFENYQNPILDKMVEAKLLDSEQWKFIEKMFHKVRAHMHEVIYELSIPADRKASMHKRIDEVQLSLPYANRELLGETYDCSKTANRASYFYFRKKLTVCAGLFYGYRSEAALTHVMAHEFAHSLDFTAQSIDRFRATPAGQAAQEIMQHEGPITSCEKWNDFLKKGVWAPLKKMPIYQDRHFDKFKNCLRDKSDLKPLKFERLLEAAQQMIGNEVSNIASEEQYSLISTEKNYLNYDMVPNEFFLRPDMKQSRDSGYTNAYKLTDSASMVHLFTYSLLCQPGKDTPRDFLALSKDEKKKVFTNAIKQSKELATNHIMRIFQQCGDECHGLVEYGMAKPSSENFADWFANKVVAKFLEKQKKEDKPQLIGEIGAILCHPGSKLDPDLLIEEHPFSRQIHGTDQLRRWFLIPPESAKELNCELKNEHIQKIHFCKL